MKIGVIVEDTLAQVDAAVGLIGPFDEAVIERLRELSKENRIVLISAIAATMSGYRLLLSRLYDARVPFDEIWTGSGIPQCDVRYDNGARRFE